MSDSTDNRITQLIARYHGDSGVAHDEIIHIWVGPNGYTVLAIFADAWFKGYVRGYEEVISDCERRMGYACEPKDLSFHIKCDKYGERKLNLSST